MERNKKIFFNIPISGIHKIIVLPLIITEKKVETNSTNIGKRNIKNIKNIFLG